MRVISMASLTRLLALFVGLGLQSRAIAQVTAPLPSDTPAVVAKPIEPMVAPIQRVKPPVPKIDPRLSGQPQAATRAPGVTTTVRAKYLAQKAKAKTTAKAKTAGKPTVATIPPPPAAKSPTVAAPTPTVGTIAKNPKQLTPPTPNTGPPVAAKKPAPPSISQAMPANQSPSVKR